ncbi:MAG TPA: aminotransferase class V-fold PLP-dependent enzyme [Devosia sp.]|nr:aminotransferase class V-fold PLP-dependent enzyme [Devosia sp.]
MSDWSPLLDAPSFPVDEYAVLADRLAALLDTSNVILLVQGEAIIALEAAATSLARPGLRVLNIVTSPYGALFGNWLRRGGAVVEDLVAPAGKPIAAAAVEAALASALFDLVSLVHAESASGILNPLPHIARAVRATGALLVVDAVASFGGHALDVDALGIDIAVVGPQKSLGGAAGVSALAVSARAWRQIEQPGGPTASVLSLLDLRAQWLDKGRGVLPGMPSPIEFHALAAALARFEAEGLDAAIARHTRAGAVTRAALKALGLAPWVPDAEASNLVTAAVLPAGIDRASVLEALAPYATGTAAAVGPGTDALLRLNHTGPRARFDTVLAIVVALGNALARAGASVDTGAAAETVAKGYADQ